MPEQPVILVVDDDDDVRDMMVEYLAAAGFTVLQAAEATSMLRVLDEKPVDLVLLDRTMPGGDSLRLVPDLRRERPELGIIVVTALGREEDFVRGLDCGADDYVSKPFHWRELAARIHAVLRRLQAEGRSKQHQAGQIGAGAGRGRSRRRVSAILFADVEGFTRMMQADEDGTVRLIRRYMDAVIAPEVAAHGGRLVKTLGDGFIAELPSGQQAVDCALVAQRKLARRNARLPAHRRLRFRMGIHVARIMVTADGDVFGDGVNLAARLQALAAPGGIVVSESVRAAIDPALADTLIDLGVRPVKNIAEPIRMFGSIAPMLPAVREAGAVTYV